jgi:hypothetical protein
MPQICAAFGSPSEKLYEAGTVLRDRLLGPLADQLGNFSNSTQPISNPQRVSLLAKGLGTPRVSLGLARVHQLGALTPYQ